MNELERKVIQAAITWKKSFGFEGNHAAFDLLSQSVDNLIAGSETRTIQECVGSGYVECFKCNARRTVDAKAQVAACAACGDAGWWNLGITLT